MTILSIITTINLILVVFFCVVILLDNSKPPEVTFAWIVIIATFQIFGIVIFIFTGINYKSRKLVKHLPEETFKKELQDIITSQREIYSKLKFKNEQSSDMAKAMSLLLNCSNSIVTNNNIVHLFHHGGELYTEMLHDLKEATQSIHMEYFIWKSDKLGWEISKILTEKAKQGVEIRLIFDGVGSFNKISRKYKKILRASGIKYVYFLDPLATPFKLLQFNYCNHRKVVVIDGRIGYTGGVNIGEEYITGGKRFDFWRDSHIKLQGDSVRMLQALFLVDWYNSYHELITDKRYFPVSSFNKGIPVQIAVSGPDSKWSSIHQLYFSMITNANTSIKIQSPYFIPDSAILKALETAALSGVEVSLMMTGHPDKKLPFWTAKTYFYPLIQAGVKIYLYNKGFLHNKVVIVDELISTVGSCNMDIRSFHINYEINCVLYDKKSTKELKDQFLIDQESCNLVTLDDLRKKAFTSKIRDSICRLFSPIM